MLLETTIKRLESNPAVRIVNVNRNENIHNIYVVPVNRAYDINQLQEFMRELITPDSKVTNFWEHPDGLELGNLCLNERGERVYIRPFPYDEIARASSEGKISDWVPWRTLNRYDPSVKKRLIARIYLY